MSARRLWPCLVLALTACAADNGMFTADGGSVSDGAAASDAARDAAAAADGGVSVADASVSDAASADASSDAGAQPDGAIRDAGPDARRTCSDVRSQYGATIASAMTCSAAAAANQCTLKVASAIGCPCQIYVNGAYQNELAALEAEWQQLACSAVCPLSLCVDPTVGECNAATGMCRSRP